jgi:transposase InsO family protein
MKVILERRGIGYAIGKTTAGDRVYIKNGDLIRKEEVFVQLVGAKGNWLLAEIQVVEDAIELYGAPEIFNTDQGSQFTSADFTSMLESHKIRISMDGKGRAIDNIFVERLWRSVKYEHVYLYIYDDAVQLYEGTVRIL